MRVSMKVLRTFPIISLFSFLIFLLFTNGCGGGGGATNNNYYAIDEPVHSNTYYAGDAITFTVVASGIGAIRHDDRFVWRSDKDGQIGEGRSYTSNLLSEGIHSIMLDVYNNEGFLFDTDQVNIAIASDRAVIKTIFVGKNPAYLAITPNGEYVYVPNHYDGTVSVIQTSDVTIVNTVGVGEGPVAVAISTDGEHAYVTNSIDNTVSIIQTKDNAVIQTVPVGDEPWGLTVAPDGDYVYSVNAGNVSVSVIDTASNSEITTIAKHPDYNPPDSTKIYFNDIVISPDGNYLYVNTLVNTYIKPDDPFPYGDGEVMVVQTSDNSIIEYISVGDLPTCNAISPNGDYVYITNAQDNSVSVIQTIDNTVIDTIAVGDFPDDITVTPSGNYIFVVNNNENTITKIRSSDNTVENTITVGALPWGVVVTPNENYIYVTNYNDDTVFVIDASKI